MFTNKVDLYEYFKIPRAKLMGTAGYLNVYVQSVNNSFPKRIRPAMLVLAGGGYAHLSDREKECIAIHYMSQGFNAFTLEYSLGPTVNYPAQLLEACMAMAYIRENAKEFMIDPEHVATIGFSAGGHLAAMLSFIPDEKEIVEYLGKRVELCRPNAVILSYPVISSGEKAHKGSFINLCGEDEELEQRLSMENRITENAPPAFIWATADDGCVPAENSLLVASVYKKLNVPFELHIFESGVHGLSLATEESVPVNVSVQPWFGLSMTWLKNRGFVIVDE